MKVENVIVIHSEHGADKTEIKRDREWFCIENNSFEMYVHESEVEDFLKVFQRYVIEELNKKIDEEPVKPGTWYATLDFDEEIYSYDKKIDNKYYYELEGGFEHGIEKFNTTLCKKLQQENDQLQAEKDEKDKEIDNLHRKVCKAWEHLFEVITDTGFVDNDNDNHVGKAFVILDGIDFSRRIHKRQQNRP